MGKQKQSKSYWSWANMIQRCNNKTRDCYQNYGGRGISVCRRWLKFENFFADMGERPEGTTLDRIDNDGNYEFGNCRWATPKQQNRNQRGNINVTLEGKTQCLSVWTRALNLPYDTIRHRIRRGWEPAKALVTSVRGYDG